MLSMSSVKDCNIEQALEVELFDYILEHCSDTPASSVGCDPAKQPQEISPVDYLQQRFLDSSSMEESINVSALLFEASNTDVKLAAKPQSVSGSHAGSQLISRQSSITDEWFGNVTNTHVNDASMDSSLEALFASTDWNDLVTVNTDDCTDVDLPSTAIKPGCVANELQSVCGNVDEVPSIEHSTSQQLSNCELLEQESAISVHSAIKKEICTSPAIATIESQSRLRRKRRISSESLDFSDGDSQFSGSGETAEDLLKFAKRFLSDGSRTKPFFWQYNAQLRGPKAKRLCKSVVVEDSHVVPDFSDPVFDNILQSRLMHSGKARQGDGNDPRPDPHKLLLIGCRIAMLESEFKIVSCDSSADSDSRNVTNQKKNQLASKICRLKKKALHAANKIKLDGLKQEHDQLMSVIRSIAHEIGNCVTNKTTTTTMANTSLLCQTLDQLIRSHLTFMIAGNTAEYVNSELEKVAMKLVNTSH